MGTLLNRNIYDELLQAHACLIDQFGEQMISGIHVPWAGEKLRTPSEGTCALYMVGIAPDKNYASDITQNFDASLKNVETELTEKGKERATSPFWQFLSGLTKHFFGEPHYECIQSWGWSNLFKIAYNENGDWPADVFQSQRRACVRALQSEFTLLSKSLIFIGSGQKHGEVIRETLSVADWNTTHENVGIHYWYDQDNRNIFVWGYHPRGAQQSRSGNFFFEMLTTTIQLGDGVASNKRLGIINK